MPVKIRLTRMGSKKRPFYRIVAMNTQTRRDGRALDFIGHYNPMVDPAEIKVDAAKLQYWLERGAQTSNTVQSLLRQNKQADA